MLEVLAVVGVFGALVAAALPAYTRFQDRKASEDAQANLLAAVSAAETYRADRGSYAGMDAVDLLQIGARVSPTLTVASARRGKYCLTDTVRGKTWSVAGPYRGSVTFTENASCT